MATPLHPPPVRYRFIDLKEVMVDHQEKGDVDMTVDEINISSSESKMTSSKKDNSFLTISDYQKMKSNQKKEDVSSHENKSSENVDIPEDQEEDIAVDAEGYPLVCDRDFGCNPDSDPPLCYCQKIVKKKKENLSNISKPTVDTSTASAKPKAEESKETQEKSLEEGELAIQAPIETEIVKKENQNELTDDEIDIQSTMIPLEFIADQKGFKVYGLPYRLYEVGEIPRHLPKLFRNIVDKTRKPTSEDYLHCVYKLFYWYRKWKLRRNDRGGGNNPDDITKSWNVFMEKFHRGNDGPNEVVTETKENRSAVEARERARNAHIDDISDEIHDRCLDERIECLVYDCFLCYKNGSESDPDFAYGRIKQGYTSKPSAILAELVRGLSLRMSKGMPKKKRSSSRNPIRRPERPRSAVPLVTKSQKPVDIQASGRNTPEGDRTPEGDVDKSFPMKDVKTSFDYRPNAPPYDQQCAQRSIVDHLENQPMAVVRKQQLDQTYEFLLGKNAALSIEMDKALASFDDRLKRVEEIVSSPVHSPDEKDDDKEEYLPRQNAKELEKVVSSLKKILGRLEKIEEKVGIPQLPSRKRSRDNIALNDQHKM